jgi:hypothetical protein
VSCLPAQLARNRNQCHGRFFVATRLPSTVAHGANAVSCSVDTSEARAYPRNSPSSLTGIRKAGRDDLAVLKCHISLDICIIGVAIARRNILRAVHSLAINSWTDVEMTRALGRTPCQTCDIP